MWDWLNAIFSKAEIYIPIIVSFLASIGIPTILATIRTASKATIYIFNVKRLLSKTNEVISYSNTIRDNQIAHLKGEINYLTNDLIYIKNKKRKNLVETRIEELKGELTTLEQLSLESVKLADKKEIKELTALEKQAKQTIKIKVVDAVNNTISK